MRKVRLGDSTLRDGMHAVSHQLTAEQMAGGLLIFACVLAVQILPLWRARRAVAAETG